MFILHKYFPPKPDGLWCLFYFRSYGAHTFKEVHTQSYRSKEYLLKHLELNQVDF